MRINPSKLKSILQSYSNCNVRYIEYGVIWCHNNPPLVEVFTMQTTAITMYIRMLIEWNCTYLKCIFCWCVITNIFRSVSKLDINTENITFILHCILLFLHKNRYIYWYTDMLMPYCCIRWNSISMQSSTLALLYFIRMVSQWCHNGRDGVSNHGRLQCLLTSWFWRRSKKPVNYLRKRPVTRKMFPCHDVSMSHNSCLKTM